jgi:hypothetical protein
MGEHIEARFRQCHALLMPVDFRRNAGLDDDEIVADVLKLDILRVTKSVLLLGRVGLNVVFIFTTFHALPERDPRARLNEARHYVAWVEMLVVGSYLFWCVGTVCCTVGVALMLQKLPRSKWPPSLERAWEDAGPWVNAHASLKLGIFAANIRSAATACPTFSVLKLVTRVSPVKIAMSMESAFSMVVSILGERGLITKLIGITAAMALMFLQLIAAALGIMGLVIKINQVDFVTQEAINPRDLSEPFKFISLIGLASAIAGLVDVDAARMDAVLWAAAAGDKDKFDEEQASNHMRFLIYGRCFQKFNVVKAVILTLTVDGNDCRRLLFGRKND